MPLLPANRIQSLPQSGALAIYQQTQQLKAQGYEICDLGIGEPVGTPPPHIQQAAKNAIDAGNYFKYPPIEGYADLRTAIANKLRRDNHIPCEAENILVSAGAKQSLANVLLSLLNPGDEIVIYTPYWATYASLVKLTGAKPVFLKGSPKHNFEPAPEQLQVALTPRTRALLFSSPCNPTGLVFSKTSLEALADVLQHYPQVLVIADEIYEYIRFVDGYTSIGSLPNMADRVVTVNGFSKSFSMTGWRVGYMAAPQWLAKACTRLQGQLTGGVNTIAQRAALAALELTEDEIVIRRIRDLYLTRRDLAVQLFKALPGFDFHIPSGAFYLFPDVRYYLGKTVGMPTMHDTNAFCAYMLTNAHVSLIPGATFGEPHCVRISYGVPEATLREANDRLQRALARWPT
ncbi:MAG: pyridoxal phosphate-dependent aminotransferase [Bacteroidota bacterium]